VAGNRTVNVVSPVSRAPCVELGRDPSANGRDPNAVTSISNPRPFFQFFFGELPDFPLLRASSFCLANVTTAHLTHFEHGSRPANRPPARLSFLVCRFLADRDAGLTTHWRDRIIERDDRDACLASSRATHPFAQSPSVLSPRTDRLDQGVGQSSTTQPHHLTTLISGGSRNVSGSQRVHSDHHPGPEARVERNLAHPGRAGGPWRLLGLGIGPPPAPLLLVPRACPDHNARRGSR